MSVRWYECNPCEQIQITRFATLGDKTPVANVAITDATTIASLLSILDSIPTHGDMYKNFGEDAERLVIAISGQGGTSTVEFYRGYIKTPDTTVISANVAEVKQLYMLALSLLH